MTQKSEMSKIREKYLTFLKKKGIVVKKFRCDDAGENKKFEKWVEKSIFNVDFEFTGANTPQHNDVVERGFATLTGMFRVMMKQTGLSEELKYKLWAECAKTVTDLDGLLISKKGEKGSFEKFFKDQQKFNSDLHSFGEIGIVLAKKKIKSKLADRGFPALFVGYTENHAGDVIKMFTPKTFKVTLTRDVRFLGKYYGEYEQLKPGDSPEIDDFDGTENTSKKVHFIDDKSSESRNWDDKDFEICVARKEFNDMIYKRKIWHHVNKSTIPDNHRLIDCKWVFKKKQNGV